MKFEFPPLPPNCEVVDELVKCETSMEPTWSHVMEGSLYRSVLAACAIEGWYWEKMRRMETYRLVNSHDGGLTLRDSRFPEAFCDEDLDDPERESLENSIVDLEIVCIKLVQDCDRFALQWREWLEKSV